MWSRWLHFWSKIQPHVVAVPTVQRWNLSLTVLIRRSSAFHRFNSLRLAYLRGRSDFVDVQNSYGSCLTMGFVSTSKHRIQTDNAVAKYRSRWSVTKYSTAKHVDMRCLLGRSSQARHLVWLNPSIPLKVELLYIQILLVNPRRYQTRLL